MRLRGDHRSRFDPGRPGHDGRAGGGCPLTDQSRAPDRPDAFTAFLIRPLAPRTAAFPGDDGRYHVVYELLLTNAKSCRPPSTGSTSWTPTTGPECS